MKRHASLYLPPVALMGLIFFLSAQPHLQSGLGVWDTILRKGAHMIEFGCLAALWHRALAGRFDAPSSRSLAVATAIALVYAASDELHQRSVAGRTASPVDILIDATGIAAAALIVRRRARSGGPPSQDTAH